MIALPDRHENLIPFAATHVLRLKPTFQAATVE